MQIIISPAKSLELEKQYIDNLNVSTPKYLKEAERINAKLKKMNAQDLMELQGISKNLAQLNEERNKAWSSEQHEEKGRPSIFTFNGDVYDGLDAYSLTREQLDFANDHLLILSGLYGLLKPLDLILPYRLEMGTTLDVGKAKNLYAYWSDALKNHMHDHYKGGFLANLASNEYSKVLDLKKIEMRVINFEFLNENNGKLKNISFFAKKARGLMARFIIENKIDKPDHLTAFNDEGYTFYPEKSTLNNLAFMR